jgi:hypothetical protein
MLIPRTPAGEYHIDTLELNSPELVKLRRDRAEENAFLKRKAIAVRGNPSYQELTEAVRRYTRLAEYLIPEFPYATPEEEELFDREQEADAALLDNP